MWATPRRTRHERRSRGIPGRSAAAPSPRPQAAGLKPAGAAGAASAPRCRSFLSDESGAVLAVIALVMPAVIGLTALSADLGRIMTLNTEMQAIADAASIAAAMELDGTEDGLDAAVAAAMAMPNSPQLAMDASGTEIGEVVFCTHPACEAGHLTDDPGLAWFVRVTTVDRWSRNIFAPVLAMAGQSSTSAFAVAGKTVVACNVQPLMMCNPYEPGPFNASTGQMFHFKARENIPGEGNTPPYAPGDFGLVDPPGQNSSTGPQLRRLLSQQDPDFCYLNQVSPRPGQNVGNVTDAINVRFDMPPNPTMGMDQTPAPNVIKGKIPNNSNNCNFDNQQQHTDTAHARLPRDTDLAVVPGARTLRVGSGNMDSAAKSEYWQYHHGVGTSWPTGMTRYEVYLHELGLNGGSPPWSGPESPSPQCAPANVRNAGDYKRRIMSVAIIDCLANNVRGNSATDLRSDKYADFFITEPSVGGEIVAEFIRLLTPKDEDSRLREIVQLYR